jgi:ADP-ribosyl-[dinitrogen reductase] hydrolase
VPRRSALDEIRARARGAFLGLAVGDALGAPVEFMLHQEIAADYGVHKDMTGGGWLRLRPGAVTDDTEMALWLGRSIAAGEGFDAHRAATHLAAWLRLGPIDVGHTVRRGLRRFVVEGSVSGPPNPGDAGNGAAMRVLPVALATLANHEALARTAVEQARITHNHPLSDAACIHVGELVQLACLGMGMPRLRQASELLVQAHPQFTFCPYPGLSGGYVAETIATVLHFLYRSRGFEECLVAVVNQGGDADTTGAIAGAIAGAWHGPEAIPRRWLRALDPVLREELEWLSGRLVDLSPFARGEAPRLADAGA